LKRSLFAELKRRNVFRAAILYVGAVWALAQGISQLGPSVGLPEWTTRWFLVAAVVGFPLWVAFAWFFEFTPEGLKRERDVAPEDSITRHTGRKLDFIIIGVMAVAIVLLVTDRFVLHHGVNEEAAVPEQSIAVLPFVDMSQGKDQEYFSDGISEELLNLLAKITQLHVAARTSSFAFKGQNIEIPEIARRLHVANVLEGSIRKAGDQVRITAQLIRAADGYHVWSETWDRKLDDIFKIQDEIAGEVVKRLKVTLLGDAPKSRTTDPQAYALYLQAREVGRQFTAEAFAKSDALYRQVLAIDPHYAPAWWSLSINFANETSIGGLSNQEGFARAREAAEKALAVDPDYAPAHAALGWIAMTFDNDLVGAARHFERAMALDPTDLRVLNTVAAFLEYLGRLDEALALDEAVARRDPVNLTALNNLCLFQRYARRYDAAIASCRTALSLNPGQGKAHSLLGVALLSKGDASGALTEMEQETSEAWRLMGLAMVYHALGRGSDSEAALSALIGKYEKDAPYSIAYVYAYCVEADQAFAWLDKAIEYRDPGISEIVRENLFDNIRKDPRWLPFLRKVGKAPEQLAKIDFKVTLPKEWQAEATAASSGARP
jgi:TolB-like protein/Flp pilus assembly protein TadD